MRRQEELVSLCSVPVLQRFLRAAVGLARVLTDMRVCVSFRVCSVVIVSKSGFHRAVTWLILTSLVIGLLIAVLVAGCTGCVHAVRSRHPCRGGCQVSVLPSLPTVPLTSGILFADRLLSHCPFDCGSQYCAADAWAQRHWCRRQGASRLQVLTLCSTRSESVQCSALNASLVCV